MIKCKVCGHDFDPVIDEHYVSRDNGITGITEVVKHTEEKLYDTFDCPACGCQVIAQERKRQYIPYSIKEDDDDE